MAKNFYRCITKYVCSVLQELYIFAAIIIIMGRHKKPKVESYSNIFKKVAIIIYRTTDKEKDDMSKLSNKLDMSAAELSRIVVERWKAAIRDGLIRLEDYRPEKQEKRGKWKVPKREKPRYIDDEDRKIK